MSSSMKQIIPALDSTAEYLQQAIIPGAFLGALIGLTPGILLILVLGGGKHRVGLAEVLGFIAMSMLAATVAGAPVGRATAVVPVAGQRALKSLRSKS